MVYDYHMVLGVLGIIAGFLGFIPYFRDIIRGTTKPHAFTWFGWGLINATACAAQIASGGGSGALVTAFTSFICCSISITAFFGNEKNITKGDWVCFIGAIFGIGLWTTTQEPLLAVIIITISDVLAFVPTIRKAFYKPYGETASSYAIATVRSLFGLLALHNFALANWLYLGAVFLSDAGFTIMLLVRRRQLEGIR
jgi:hypothetical protein